MNRFFLLLAAFLCVSLMHAQDIPQHLSYSRIYDFLDELANDGFIELNSTVKPYSRSFITEKLLETTKNEKKLSRRQKAELYYFLEEFALEQNRLPEHEFIIHEARNSTLGLVPPIFHYCDSSFRARIQPILGMHIFSSPRGSIHQRWFGADFQAMIGKHISIYGSIRDISFSGTKKISDYTSSQRFERLSAPTYLTNLPGYQYKEPSDFSDSRGGVKLSWNWGSVGLVKDHVAWGDGYNGANILSGRAPSFPMITLRIKPTKWFELNYMHGWLISNVVDSAKFYIENGVKKWYRNHNKYIAANMFTFTPIPKLNLSFGNSIIYAEDNIQPGYLVPIAFYKSTDHLLTKGIKTENQNSQLFLNISSRNIKHIHLYSSVFIDEIKLSRFKRSSAERNPLSLKAGGKITNFPVRNLSLTAEFTRTNIINYKHSIAPLAYTSNGYNLGHYLGDNAQEFYAAIGYKPIRGLDLSFYYLDAKHGNEYSMMKYDASGSPHPADDKRQYILSIISRPSLGDVIWTNKTIGFKALYEIFANGYALINIEHSDISGYEAASTTIPGEIRMTAQETLNYFTPPFLHGKNTTITIGFSLGF